MDIFAIADIPICLWIISCHIPYFSTTIRIKIDLYLVALHQFMFS